MSAGTSTGRRNSGRSGPVASDQAKSSAYKGVSWHKHSQKWYAYIQSGGKMRGLGYFDSQADAAEAYDTEARKVSTSAHPSYATMTPHNRVLHVIAAGYAGNLLQYFGSCFDVKDINCTCCTFYNQSLVQVHGKKAVVNFRLSSGEIQWQPRNKRGASNSSAETSCPSLGEHVCRHVCCMLPFLRSSDTKDKLMPQNAALAYLSAYNQMWMPM